MCSHEHLCSDTEAKTKDEWSVSGCFKNKISFVSIQVTNLLHCISFFCGNSVYVSVYIFLFIKYFIHTINSLTIATLLFNLSGMISAAHHLIRTIVYKQIQKKIIHLSHFAFQFILSLYTCLSICLSVMSHGSIAGPGWGLVIGTALSSGLHWLARRRALQGRTGRPLAGIRWPSRWPIYSWLWGHSTLLQPGGRSRERDVDPFTDTDCLIS